MLQLLCCIYILSLLCLSLCINRSQKRQLKRDKPPTSIGHHSPPTPRSHLQPFGYTWCLFLFYLALQMVLIFNCNALQILTKVRDTLDLRQNQGRRRRAMYSHTCTTWFNPLGKHFFSSRRTTKSQPQKRKTKVNCVASVLPFG